MGKSSLSEKLFNKGLYEEIEVKYISGIDKLSRGAWI
jgi:hypothetical protein